MAWFYRMARPIMTPDTFGEPPRLANQEVLKVRDEEVESMTAVCRRVQR